MAVKCKFDDETRVPNFTLNSGTTAEKLAKTIRGLLFLPHPTYNRPPEFRTWYCNGYVYVKPLSGVETTAVMMLLLFCYLVINDNYYY